jgi:hypothetical protein
MGSQKGMIFGIFRIAFSFLKWRLVITFFAMKTFLPALFLVFTISCHSTSNSIVQTQSNPPTDYLVFGVYCGECYGHCATMYKVDDTKLLIDSTDSFFKMKEDSVIFPIGGTSGPRFITAHDLMSKIPPQLMLTDTIEFGEPDALDQCGIYVEFQINGKKKQKYIDTDTSRIPSYVTAFSKDIYKTISGIRK